MLRSNADGNPFCRLARTDGPQAQTVEPLSYRDFLDFNHPKRENGEPPNSHATRGLTPCSPRATSIAYEHNRVDLRLLRLRPRQQPSFHGRGEKVRPNSGREPHPSGLWRRVGG